MPRKTITIFIITFVLVGACILGFYYYKNKAGTTGTDTSNSIYNTFNPFSSNTSSNSNTTSTNEDTNILNDTSSIPASGIEGAPQASKFHKITEFAVAGATYFEDTRPITETIKVEPGDLTETPTPTVDKKVTPKTKTPIKKVTTPKFEIAPSLRYVDRVTGHIYQMYLDTKTEGKNSNSTIPAIYGAMFDSKAGTVIYRYLASDNSISSFMATLGGTKGEFLPTNITDLSLSPDKTKFFYLVKNTSGVTGFIRAFGETKTTQVWTSPFDEWLSQWVGGQKIYLTTKASASVNGYLYSLNTSNGSITKIFGGVPGLTTLASNDGSLVLYSSSLNSGPKLGIFNVAKHTTTGINAYGLPEKCVWSIDNINIYCAIPNSMGGGKYPDIWYQGKESFNDHFIKVNISNGEITQIADSADEIPLDGTHLFLNKAENQLFLINKKDSTLWSLDLK